MFLAQSLAAQDQPEATAGATAADARVTSEASSLVSLLEFIGEFTTEDGEWLDPELLEQAESDGAEPSADQTENCSDPQCE